MARAGVHRSQGLIGGETTFMVEDYVPERIEFDVSTRTNRSKLTLP